MTAARCVAPVQPTSCMIRVNKREPEACLDLQTNSLGCHRETPGEFVSLYIEAYIHTYIQATYAFFPEGVGRPSMGFFTVGM